MPFRDLLIELAAGVAAGIFAGATGAGGGILLVPILVFLGLPPLSATGTSNVAISMSAASGTYTNLRRFGLPWRRVLLLALPAMVCAPVGVLVGGRLPAMALLLAFAAFNVTAIGLLQWRLVAPLPGDTKGVPSAHVGLALVTGAVGGVLAGLFGVGGGLIMVPLQSLLLRTPVRVASRISLGVVLFASLSAVATHAVTAGDIAWVTGLVMAVGGLVGAPIGAHWLHRMTDRQSTRVIQATMAVVAAMFVWRALG